MSYNTRRSGPGMGRGTSEVLYHQTPQRSGPRMGQNQNYSNQQQSANSGYGSQPNKPYSAQSAPPPSAPQSQGSYSTQSSFQSQQKQQQQQQQQPQQQQPPPQPIKVEPPPTPTAAPPPAPAPVAPVAPPAAPPSSAMDVDADSAGDGSTEVKPKPWLKKKVPGFKPNKKVKRRRQNARLRKILQPKNAIMVLNELKTGIKFTFQEHTNALTQTMFVVNAEVDGKSYIGQGLSKPLAKQNAAENALKALLLEKMAEAAMKASDSSNDVTEPMQQDVNNGVAPNTTATTTTTATPANNTSTPDSAEGSEVGSEVSKANAPEDDVPWGSLASFALYKLFTEWQSQGTHVPIPKQQTVVVVPPVQPAKTSAPAPMKKIPDNPTERHPVMLLNQLKPGVQFSEISREGTTPNLTFTLGVTIDGKSYVGVAKNKKDAKKEAAKSALAGTFNIFYD